MEDSSKAAKDAPFEFDAICRLGSRGSLTRHSWADLPAWSRATFDRPRPCSQSRRPIRLSCQRRCGGDIILANSERINTLVGEKRRLSDSNELPATMKKADLGEGNISLRTCVISEDRLNYISGVRWASRISIPGLCSVLGRKEER